MKTASKFTKSVLKSKSLKQLLNFNGVHYKDVKVCQDSIDVYATVSRKYGICPACGKRSHAVHSSYVRHLVSLPVHGKRLNIHLVTRRFRCDNTRCGQKYFSEQLAGVSSRYSRRTPCATERLEKLFLEVSVCILTILTPILMMLTPSKRAGLSKSSLCLLANRQQRSCKDITFSFS